MSQARVTDFFVQRKNSASEVAQGIANKTYAVHNGGDTETSKHSRRSTRSSRSAAPTKKLNITASTTQHAGNSVHEEFLRVIDEAASVDHVDNGRGVLAKSEPEKQTLLSSPRTPKRTSADAEFDLGSAVFSATAEHTTAKKRLRVENNTNARGKIPECVKVVKKSARKKLILSDDNEKTTDPLAEDVMQVPNLMSADKESTKLVHHSVNSSPTSKLHGLPKTGNKDKTFSKKDIASLESRLQKIKSQYPKDEKLSSVAPTATVSDLKARLARVKELAAKAQQKSQERFSETICTEENNQPQAEDGEKLPAYQRFHTLAQNVPPSLSLPYKYKLLAEMFRSMDTIVGMLFNRSETVTFAKVKQGVQDMTRKCFEETHVGQIKAVFPTAYHFRQERNIPTFSATVKKSSYQLTIEPVIEADKSEPRPVLAASRLLERRYIFHQNLVRIVKEHHKAYLATLNPPIAIPDDKLTRWHPRFNVDEVPGVLPVELPQPPQGAEKLTTAQEVLDKARSMMTPKMEKALANMALKTAEAACVEKVDPPAPVAPVETPRALKGVSQSLLERIRAKEAQKLQAAMTRNPQQEERLRMMSRLGELARILRNVFVAEKKPALIMEVACNRMVSSYRSALSTGEMEKHLCLLAELTPEWLTIHAIRKDFYLKLNKNMDLNIVLEKLRQKTREEESL
ncbi:hypothetical protein UPYG_G00082650 [Umbra pygmaea]|uniref:CDT1 Geminin-binding domain-containing protein n=1 Tax=Umbra pygmaea TaxID=75934 RepID=A0ABD0XGR7_UMBPY